MNLFQRLPSAVALFASLLAIAGCTTPPQPDGESSSTTPPIHPASPFLAPQDYSDRLDRAMGEILRDHRFSIPDVAVRDADSSIWFVAERFDSEQRFERLFVRVNPDQQVSATITSYAFGPSDWGILGRIFADPRPEAESIAAQVARRLSQQRRSAE